MKPSWFPVSVVAVMYQQKAVEKKREAKARGKGGGGERKNTGGKSKGKKKSRGAIGGSC
jgi:hypothetical protein